MQPRMFSSELKLSTATAKLFHLERFAIYGIRMLNVYVCVHVNAYRSIYDTSVSICAYTNIYVLYCTLMV